MYDTNTLAEAASFDLSSDQSLDCCALLMAVLYRVGDEWWMYAIGEGAHGTMAKVRVWLRSIHVLLRLPIVASYYFRLLLRSVSSPCVDARLTRSNTLPPSSVVSCCLRMSPTPSKFAPQPLWLRIMWMSSRISSVSTSWLSRLWRRTNAVDRPRRSVELKLRVPPITPP